MMPWKELMGGVPPATLSAQRSEHIQSSTPGRNSADAAVYTLSGACPRLPLGAIAQDAGATPAPPAGGRVVPTPGVLTRIMHDRPEVPASAW
jgi:hypothetical protein